jgi:hypothetical protein
MALRIEDVLDMWKTDSEIDELKLDEASQQSARLHAKYLEMLSVTRLQLKKKEAEFKVLLKDKFLWYNGKMSKDEMDARGWDYDPLNGLKVLKGDMDRFYDSDSDIQNAQMKIDYLKELVSTLEEIMIMSNIRWRHQNIKNMIEHRKFTSGI